MFYFHLWKMVILLHLYFLIGHIKQLASYQKEPYEIPHFTRLKQCILIFILLSFYNFINTFFTSWAIYVLQKLPLCKIYIPNHLILTVDIQQKYFYLSIGSEPAVFHITYKHNFFQLLVIQPQLQKAGKYALKLGGKMPSLK